MKPIAQNLVVLLTVAGALSACGESGTVAPAGQLQFEPGAIEVALVDSVAGPGRTLRIEQRNRLAVPVGYNHCGRAVQRREGDVWVTLPPELRLCTAELHALSPGVAEVVHVDVPADAGAGRYRFLLAFAPMSGQGTPVTVPTPAFVVR